MADNYLMLDGKKYELSPELANALRSCVEPEPEKESPFERHLNARYFHIDQYGNASGCYKDSYDDVDEKLYAVANYCTDKSLMEQRAMHETLYRLLWRYSEEHGGDPEWDGSNFHISIYFDRTDGVFGVRANEYFKSNGVTYFKDKATAEAAIEEIVKPFLAAHPDFVW